MSPVSMSMICTSRASPESSSERLADTRCTGGHPAEQPTGSGASLDVVAHSGLSRRGPRGGAASRPSIRPAGAHLPEPRHARACRIADLLEDYQGPGARASFACDNGSAAAIIPAQKWAPVGGALPGARRPGGCPARRYTPTIDTKLTQRPGAPPRLCVSPSFGSLICRGPASPRSWSHISYIMRSPLAPIGCPKLLSPPSGFTGWGPSPSNLPASTSFHP